MEDTKSYEKALKEELKNYQKLERINKSDEFNDFFELQISTCVQKMLTLFTGNGPKDWAEFQRIRAEVVATLYPIQQVRGAKVLKQRLVEQLNDIYNTESS